MAKETMKTLAPPRSPGAPRSEGVHLQANRDVMDQMMRRLRKDTDSLASQLNAEIGSRPNSPHIGEVVLYRMGEGPSAGDQRPAIVVIVHESEGNRSRCALKVICSPDHDATGVLDEPNVEYGTGLEQWLPLNTNAKLAETGTKDRVPVGQAMV